MNDPVKGTVLNYVCSVRDILSGIYKGNEQKLGVGGFEMDQSTKGWCHTDASVAEQVK